MMLINNWVFLCDVIIEEEQTIEESDSEIEENAEDYELSEESNDLADVKPEEIDEAIDIEEQDEETEPLNENVYTIDQEETDEVVGIVEAIDVEEPNNDEDEDFVEDNAIELSVSELLLSTMYYLSNISPLDSVNSFVNSNSGGNEGNFQSFSPNISPLTSFHSPSDGSSSAAMLIPTISILLVLLL